MVLTWFNPFCKGSAQMNSKNYELESLALKNLGLVYQSLSKVNNQMNEKTFELKSLGLKNLGHVYRNLSVPQLMVM